MLIKTITRCDHSLVHKDHNKTNIVPTTTTLNDPHFTGTAKISETATSAQTNMDQTTTQINNKPKTITNGSHHATPWPTPGNQTTTDQTSTMGKDKTTTTTTTIVHQLP